MVLVLVVGDVYLSQRRADIPLVFRNMFTPGRIHTILITGNVGSKDVVDYFRTVCPQVYCTHGVFDNEQWAAHLPSTLTFTIEQLRFGLIHGYQVIPAGDKDALAAIQRTLNVDVLLSGATHAAKVSEFDNRLLVNPGSITGAFQANQDANTTTPSFILLDVRGRSVTSFIYQLTPVSSDDDDDDDDDDVDNNVDSSKDNSLNADKQSIDLVAAKPQEGNVVKQNAKTTTSIKNKKQKQKKGNNGLRIKKKEWIKV